jgi:hypothetical protein
MSRQPIFNGRLYGPLGFANDDGEGVCFSDYEIELELKKLHWTGGSSNSRSKIKAYLIKRDGLRCKYCQIELTRKTATIDHYVPIKMWQSWLAVDGDNDNITNLVLACHKCNLVKGSKSPVGFERKKTPDTWWLKAYVRFRRHTTRLWLILKGTRTLRGEHKGHYKYLERKGIKHVHKGAEFNKDIII